MKKFVLSAVVGLSIACNASAEEAIAKKVSIASNRVSTVSALTRLDAVSQKIEVKGKVKTATLLSDVNVNYDKPFTQYDSLYFKVNFGYNEVGGHVKNYSPSIDLSNVDVFVNVNKKAINESKNVNFVEALNSEGSKKVTSFISSGRAGRKINDLSIVYTCEDNSDCEITLK